MEVATEHQLQQEAKNKDWKNEHNVGPQTEKNALRLLIVNFQIHKTHYILTCTFSFFHAGSCQLDAS